MSRVSQQIHELDLNDYVFYRSDRADQPKADLTFLDPPYNIGIDYGSGRIADKLSDERYDRDLGVWIENAAMITKEGGVLAVLISEDQAFICERHLRSMKDKSTYGIELIKVARIIWREKFAQYTEARWTNEHRHLFLYRRAGGGSPIWNNGPEIRVPSVRMQMGDKRAKGPRVPGDVWECPRMPGNAKNRVDWHSAQLNQTPLSRLVHAYTNEGGRVNELFSGSASLAVVCKKLGRNYTGWDSNPDYVRLGNKRIKES